MGTAITSVSTGFIKYDVRTDYIHNDLTNLSNVHEESKENNEEQKDAMFDIDDLKKMMKREEQFKNDAVIKDRKIAQLEQDIVALNTDLQMKNTEIESIKNISTR